MRRSARPLLTGVVAAALAGSGIAALALTGDDGTPLGDARAAAVTTFSDCDGLLDHLRTKASSLVGPYGLPGEGGPMRVMGAREGAAVDGAVPSAAGASGSGAGGGAGASALPVEQVDGVHEADVVGRTSGGLLVSLTQAPPTQDAIGEQVLRVTRLDAAAHRAQVLGSIRLRGLWNGTLLVSGSKAVVLGDTGRSGPVGVAAPGGAVPDAVAPAEPARGPAPKGKPPVGTTPSPSSSAEPTPAAGGRLVRVPEPQAQNVSRLLELDLSDPAHPRTVRMLDVEGSLLQARSVGSALRVAVTRSTTALPWVYPSSEAPEARERATSANRDLVLHADLGTWVPSATLTELDGDGAPSAKPRTTRLLDCSALSAPSTFAGLGTVSLVSADLDRGGLAQWDAAGLLASGTTLYATPTTTYVAAGDWTPPATSEGVASPGKLRTQIHAFATDPGALAGGTHYLASGEVPGSLLGQWAMDEHDGVLRVASSLASGPIAVPMEGDVAGSAGSAGAAATSPTDGDRSDVNRITILRRTGTRLERVGVLGGFGKGETIRGVRFLGDVGYVVTYRQTDPLFTLDLREPARPRVLGQLKLLGYSSFLQPVGPGRLLGVGRSGDEGGRTTGVQVSLFDVSDPAAPRRLSAAGVLGAWSDVEADHHAFSVGDGLALTTYSRWGTVPTPDEGGQADPGVAVGEPRPAEPPQSTEFDAGVLAVRIDGDALQTHLLRPLADGPTRVRVDGQDGGDSTAVAQRLVPLRTLAQDGVIWTLTESGIAAHDATTFHRLGFTRF